MMALIKYNIVHFRSGDFFSRNVEQNILEISLFTFFSTFSSNEKLGKFSVKNHRLVPGFQHKVLYQVKKHHFFFQNLFSKPRTSKKKNF